MRPSRAIVVAFLCSACSWSVVQRAPSYPEQLLASDCTSSVAAPVADLLLGGLSLAVVMGAAGADDRTWSGTEDRGTTVATGIGVALASFLSAGYGFYQTNLCRKAKEGIFPSLDLSAPPPQGALSPQDCVPLLPALARAGSEIHAAPDTQARVIRTLKEETAVCAGIEPEGFGLRRVKLQDGTTGFAVRSDLSSFEFEGALPVDGGFPGGIQAARPDAVERVTPTRSIHQSGSTTIGGPDPRGAAEQ